MHREIGSAIACESASEDEESAIFCRSTSPSAAIALKAIGKAEIKDYELLFKGSKSGNYATIEPKEGSKVPVLVWSITEQDERNLDFYEGFPTFYYKKELPVEIESIRTGDSIGEFKAMVYIMDERRQIGSPSVYYYQVLAEGYERFGFDMDILREALEKTRVTA